jgi:membrane peptidoglycan carboxypeptidase
MSFLGGSARGILAIASLLICGVLIAVGFIYASLAADLPSIEQLPVLLDRQNGELLQPTLIYDRSGSQIIAAIGNDGVTRHFLTVNPDEKDHFSLQLVKLTTAELDPTFWSSSGATSFTDNETQAQTIAERLAKSLLLATEQSSRRTNLRTKLLAYQIVKTYGRTQTLEWFLNSVYMGHQNYGVESAAQFYLHKSAADLSLAESALMVSLMQSPALNPADAPAAALENEQTLLKKLSENDLISTDEYKTARAEKLSLFGDKTDTSDQNTEFIKQVISQLDKQLGQDRVERGGLIVTTSLDLDVQAQLECTAHYQLIQIASSAYTGVAVDSNSCPAANLLPTQSFNWEGSSELIAGGLVMEPQTGQVLAYLVPTTINGTKENPDLELGSLATPFVALASFARGTSPASLQWDVPSMLPAAVSQQTNPDGTFHGPVSVRNAIANDYIVPFAALLDQMNTQTVWTLANAAGLSSPKKEDASIDLLFNGGAASLLEAGQAYNTLAAEGNRNGVLISETGEIEPVFVLNVRSSTGQSVIDNTIPQTQAMVSRSLSYLINNVLSDESSRWTSLGHPNVLEIGRTTAVKNGQVSDKNQVWTVGYTPERLVLAWVGQAAQDSQQKSAMDIRMSAGLWNAMMQYVTQSLPDDPWQQPIDVSTVQVCSPSGMLPTSICPNIVSDVFLNGNEPTQADTLYVKKSINRETGLLATVFTPTDMIEDQVYLDVPAAVRDWASAAGLSIPPLGYDAISAIQTNPLVQISSPDLFAPVSGKVTIKGTAAVEDLASYQVQIGQGINPQSWQQVGTSGTSAITDSTLAVWDTTGLDGLYAIRLNVVNKSNQIQTAVIQVTVDNTAPEIKISYPVDGSAITPTANIVTLSADVTDQVGVARVEWWLDGKKIGERTQAPFTYLWTPKNGEHKLQIKAFDTAGNTSESEMVQFSIGH